MANHDAEIGQFVQERWPRLVRAAVLLGCSPADAEDLVQTTLVRCVVHWERLAGADDPDAYVHRVLLNSYRSGRRRFWHRERPTHPIPELQTRDEYADVERADAVLRSLQRLSPDQRSAVVLRYYGNFTEAQMAAILGVAPGTVKSRLARALEVLARDPGLAELGGHR